MSAFDTRPDCVHCRFMIRQKDGEYRCRHHDVTLHTPVQMFCKQIEPLQPEDDDYRLWFEQSMQVDSLENNVLYTWVSITTSNSESQRETHTHHDLVAPFAAYITWSAGTFWQIIRKLRMMRRTHYKQHGFNLDDGA